MKIRPDPLITHNLPSKALNKIKAKQQRRPNVHLKPEHKIDRNRFQLALVLDQNDAGACEEDEQDWVEEAEGEADYCLVDYGGD